MSLRSRTSVLGRLFFASLFLATISATTAAADTGPPDAARAAGFTQHSFSSAFAPATLDLRDTRGQGFDWYLGRFFGYRTRNADALRFEPDGSVTIVGGEGNYDVATAAPGAKPGTWVGTAFGGGGYFEAVLRFDPADAIRNGFREWPAFWSMAVEHMAGLPGEQWPGQTPGYAHFVEPDFFEYDLLKYGLGQNFYGGAMHDWYGVYGTTCAKTFCEAPLHGAEIRRQIPAGTDLTQFHRYGFLWIPAANGRSGSGHYFFDGVEVGRPYLWSAFRDEPPPPDAAPWRLGVLDRQHLVVILGTGNGEPMTIKRVDVWQRNLADNWVR